MVRHIIDEISNISKHVPQLLTWNNSPNIWQIYHDLIISCVELGEYKPNVYSNSKLQTVNNLIGETDFKENPIVEFYRICTSDYGYYLRQTMKIKVDQLWGVKYTNSPIHFYSSCSHKIASVNTTRYKVNKIYNWVSKYNIKLINNKLGRWPK